LPGADRVRVMHCIWLGQMQGTCQFLGYPSFCR